jgi:hypothetical protein
LRAIVLRLVNAGARAKEDARWRVSVLPPDLLRFFRSEITVAIREKAGDPVKARKIFLSLGQTAKVIFGPQYASEKKKLDTESRAAVRKTDTQ